ncbi:unnamed protein product [Coregonus sp. 'balchen']|nr:unnamed protein product [Coregonus sp. 'balchen']
MQLPVEICVFLLSLVAPGVLYTMNNVIKQPVMVLTLGAAVLYIIPYIMSFLVLHLLALQHWENVDPLFYVFAVFSFTCLVGLTNALEQDGYISGYMGFYLKKGEPHLSAAYAVMMNYWEGVLHFLLFLIIIHRMFRGKSYRSLALFWAGSSIAHQIVFIPGVVIGKYGSSIHPAFWRNTPFLLLPIWGAILLFSRERELPIIPADKVALDCPLDTCFTYIYQYEPYLKDPVVFPRITDHGELNLTSRTLWSSLGSWITMLVYLFYALPLLAAFIYGLRNPGCTWMLDWAIFFAGAIAQTQWCHIGGSLHSRTPFTYRVPTDKWLTVMILNGLYVAVPILLAIRCRISPTFFMPTVPEGQTSPEKKDN